MSNRDIAYEVINQLSIQGITVSFDLIDEYEKAVSIGLEKFPAHQQPAAVEPRPCTCHPDDNPPVPCAQKYTYAECVASVQPDADAGDERMSAEKFIEYIDKQRGNQVWSQDLLLLAQAFDAYHQMKSRKAEK